MGHQSQHLHHPLELRLCLEVVGVDSSVVRFSQCFGELWGFKEGETRKNVHEQEQGSSRCNYQCVLRSRVGLLGCFVCRSGCSQTIEMHHSSLSRCLSLLFSRVCAGHHVAFVSLCILAGVTTSCTLGGFVSDDLRPGI